MSLFKYCGDCSKETDCEWCEVCSSFLCSDCDPTHDCLSDCLDQLSDEEAEELAIDAQFEASDDDDGGHA